MTELILQIFCCMLGTIPFVYSWLILLTPKKNTFSYKLTFFLCEFAILLVKFYFDNTYGVTITTITSNLIATFLLMCFFSKESFKEIAKFYCFFIAFLSLTEIIIASIIYKFGVIKLYFKVPPIQGRLITNFFFPIFMVAIIYIWKRIKDKTIRTRVWQFIIIFVSQMICVEINVVVFLSKGKFINTYIILIFLGISWIITDIFFVKSIFDDHRKSELSVSLNQALEMEKMQYEYYEKLTHTINTMRKYRHDFGNILQTLSVTISNPQTVENGKELFEQICQRFDDTQIPYYYGNPVINALLLLKSQSAKEKNINLDISVNLENTSMIENLDLCSIFSNLLDNALEAASDVQNGKITLTAGSDTGYLFIKCENSYNGGILKNGNKYTSTKGKNRGLGLSIIESIAKKYHGSLLTECHDVFSVLATLKLSK